MLIHPPVPSDIYVCVPNHGLIHECEVFVNLRLKLPDLYMMQLTDLAGLMLTQTSSRLIHIHKITDWKNLPVKICILQLIVQYFQYF